MKYFNSFDLFMESFRDKHREWFEGPVVRKAVEGANAGNVVSLEGPLSEPLKNIEEVDFKLKAAGEDWDGIEDVIEEGVDEDI